MARPISRNKMRRKIAARARRARKANKRSVINRALQPVPQRYVCKMKYADSVTADASGRYTFNLNSIFDPNRSGIGHQPYGFDTLATLYNRYRVISCGYRIQSAATTSQASGQSFQIAAQPANETLAYTTLSEMKENPRSKYIVQTAGGGSVILRGKTYIPSLVGRTKTQYMSDDRYQADVTTSPQELAILNIMTSATGSDAGSALTFNILLEYTVEFFDMKHLVQS